MIERLAVWIDAALGRLLDWLEGIDDDAWPDGTPRSSGFATGGPVPSRPFPLPRGCVVEPPACESGPRSVPQGVAPWERDLWRKAVGDRALFEELRRTRVAVTRCDVIECAAVDRCLHRKPGLKCDDPARDRAAAAPGPVVSGMEELG